MRLLLFICILQIIDSFSGVSIGVTKYFLGIAIATPPAYLSRTVLFLIIMLWFLSVILSSSSACSRQSLNTKMSQEQFLSLILFTSSVKRNGLPFVLMAVHRIEPSTGLLLGLSIVVAGVPAALRPRPERGCPCRMTWWSWRKRRRVPRLWETCDGICLDDEVVVCDCDTGVCQIYRS